MYFRNQNRQWQNHAVEEESEHVGYEFSDKEEAVDNVELLIKSHFLPNKTFKLRLETH